MWTCQSPAMTCQRTRVVRGIFSKSRTFASPWRRNRCGAPYLDRSCPASVTPARATVARGASFNHVAHFLRLQLWRVARLPSGRLALGMRALNSQSASVWEWNSVVRAVIEVANWRKCACQPLHKPDGRTHASLHRNPLILRAGCTASAALSLLSSAQQHPVTIATHRWCYQPIH